MSLNPPQDYRKTGYTHRRGLASARPAATEVLVGTLYYSTDTLSLSRSNGATWDSYGPAGNGGFFEQTTTATGSQNNFSLDRPKTYLRCTGAAPVFTGFTVDTSAPNSGDEAIIDCLGTTTKVTNQDGGSTAAHRIISPSANGQIIGLAGRMHLIYDGTTDRWREQVLSPGEPIAHTFAAGDYTSDTGTWVVASGDVAFDRYVQIAKLLYLWSTINTSTVTGTPNQLRKLIPGGFNIISGTQYSGMQPGYDNNVFTPTLISGNSAAFLDKLRINRADFANWANSTDLTWVYFSGNAFLIE